MEDGSPYYVMPYLADNLVNLIGKDAIDPSVIAELKPEERPRKLPVERPMTVLEQVLQALKEVHGSGLVHRDIKPENLLFNAKEEIQLCDFGIAKLPEGKWSQSGVAMGSRDYMSPEQRESAKHVDARTDVYAVGVLIYRMLTGELPVGRYKDPIEHIPEIGQGMNDLILSCLSQNRDGRPRDGTDTLARFGEAQSGPNPLLEGETTEIGVGPAVQAQDNAPREDVTEIEALESARTQPRSAVGETVTPWTSWREQQARAAVLELDRVANDRDGSTPLTRRQSDPDRVQKEVQEIVDHAKSVRGVILFSPWIVIGTGVLIFLFR